MSGNEDRERFTIDEIPDCDCKERSEGSRRTSVFMNAPKNFRVEDGLVLGDTAFFCMDCKKNLKQGTVIFSKAPDICPFCRYTELKVTNKWGGPFRATCKFCEKVFDFFKDVKEHRMMWE